MPSSSSPRAVILVEGASDQRSLEVLARRRGRDLAVEGVAVVAMGGITNLSRHLDGLPSGVLVTGLYDRGEEAWVQRALARRETPVSLRVCDADLEDELIRALGVPACVEVIDAQGDSAAWATLLNQPFHRSRPEHDVLHRFLGTTSGRKIEYAGLLTAAACDRECVPAPLDAVLRDTLA
jgi:hypothetical protein